MLLRYPVFLTLLTKKRDVSLLIAAQRSKDVDVATELYKEWKLASNHQDIFIKERIASILFELIVSRALNKWLANFLASRALTLVPEDFEDWKSDAMVKILAGKNFDPDKGAFLGWAFIVAKYCWLDELRNSYNEQQGLISYDEEIIEEWQVQEGIVVTHPSSDPEAEAIQNDLRERLIGRMKNPNDKKILWAVSAGIPWHSTWELAAVTGLTLPQITKGKERIKKTLSPSPN